MKDDDDRKPKLSLLDLEAIIDAAVEHAELLNAMETAYHRADMKELLMLLEKLFCIKKESVH